MIGHAFPEDLPITVRYRGVAALAAELERVASEIDLLYRNGVSGDGAMALNDALHAVYRAISALEEAAVGPMGPPAEASQLAS